jgi:hypothetical protein
MQEVSGANIRWRQLLPAVSFTQGADITGETSTVPKHGDGALGSEEKVGLDPGSIISSVSEGAAVRRPRATTGRQSCERASYFLTVAKEREFP